MVVSVISALKAILQVGGNMADGLALIEWFDHQQKIDLLDVYCNAYKEAFDEQVPHTAELRQGESIVFDREVFHRELRHRTLRIETIPAVADQLDNTLARPLTELLCNSTVISGTYVSEQTARNIITAAHRKYQRKALMLSSGPVLQSQISALAKQSEEQVDKLLNALTHLELLLAKQDEIPVPKVYLPDLAPWMQVLSLERLDDSPRFLFEQSCTPYSLLQSGLMKVVLVAKSGGGKTSTMQAMVYTLLTQPGQSGYCAWIPLRTYAHTLMRTIKNSIGWEELPDEEIVPALEHFQTTLFLDGLNEVSEGQRDQCAAEIEQLIRSFDGRLVVSYPTHDHAYFDLDCPAYEILPLSDEQIRQTVNAYFTASGRDDRASWFMDRMTGSEQGSQEFFSIARTPLNLQFLLELAQTEDFRSSSIRDVYRQVMEQRLKWSGKRGKAGTFPVETKVECLTDLAFRSLAKDHSLRMLRSYVLDTISTRLTDIQAAQALNEIVRSGLLVGTDGYLEWFHPSFRDYLAGRRLLSLAEADESLQQFPLGEPQSVGAVGYAVGLSTGPSVELPNRPCVFESLLRMCPPLETVHAAVAEYHLPYVIGDCTDLNCVKAEFQSLQWGERFLEAYHLIEDISRQSNLPCVSQIPSPKGLKVLFSATADFCVVLFSDIEEMSFGALDQFNVELLQAMRQHRKCDGLCLHGHLLPTLDPEIAAYIQVGAWLRLLPSKSDKNQVQKWHEDMSTYAPITPRDWMSWYSDEDPPEPSPRTRVWKDRLLLTWEGFYAPVTFRVDPVATPARSMMLENRVGQIMVTVVPENNVSLALLLPFSPKAARLDMGKSIFVPFPVPALNRYYFLHSYQWSFTKGGRQPMFVHLRG